MEMPLAKLSSSTLRQSRAARLALTVLAGIAAFAVPPLPFLRRRAWHIFALAAISWLVLLVIFFTRAAGAAFFFHIILAGLGIGALIFPRPLSRAEARLSRLRGRILSR